MYMNGVGFEILARTSVSQLPPSYRPPTPPHPPPPPPNPSLDITIIETLSLQVHSGYLYNVLVHRDHENITQREKFSK